MKEDTEAVKPNTPSKVLWVIALVILLALAGLAYIAWHEHWPQKAWNSRPKPEMIAPGFYKITYVYDGDTFAVDMNGTVEKVRLIGIDTPETHKPNTPLQCYGNEASDFAKQLETGKLVRLEADPTNSNRDRYNRLLRYAYLQQGDFINKEMIERGYAFAYTPFTFEKKQEFLDAEKVAKDSSVGLWGACEIRLEKGVYQTNNAD